MLTGTVDSLLAAAGVDWLGLSIPYGKCPFEWAQGPWWLV